MRLSSGRKEVGIVRSVICRGSGLSRTVTAMTQRPHAVGLLGTALLMPKAAGPLAVYHPLPSRRLRIVLTARCRSGQGLMTEATVPTAIITKTVAWLAGVSVITPYYEARAVLIATLSRRRLAAAIRTSRREDGPSLS